MKYWCILIFLLPCPFIASAQDIIPVNFDNIINISTIEGAELLFDEQSLAGDPQHGSGGVPQTQWQPGWTSWRYPASLVIDLKAYYQLTGIYLYDVNSEGNISFYAGQPFAWDSIANDDQQAYFQWKGHETDIRTRYVMVTVWSPNVVPTEILFYGTIDSVITETIVPVPTERPIMNDFVGLNGFIDDPVVEVLAVGGFLREYHNWSFTEVDSNVCEFNRWNGFWDFDAYYADLKNAGVTVCPCIQRNVDFHSSDGRSKPLYDWEDPADPQSYEEHARHMYQYAARYGKTSVPLSNLTLNEGQEEKTGLDLLTYYENWNEQDAWWMEREGWFSPFEYAAMASADIDGHKGIMGDGVGLKTADPNAKMVMGGLANLDLEYIKSMMFWSEFHRNGDFPADVLNFHHYCSDRVGTATGISPEADSLRERIARLVNFRDTYLPGKELWITEFGYDTHARSIQRAPAYAGFSAYEVQAMWLIRSYLAIAAGGADKAAMYMSRDVDNTDSGVYSSSGLTTEKGVWEKKDSWYYVSTFRKLMGNLQFEEQIESGNPNVWIYAFGNDTLDESALVVWCPTSDGTVIGNYLVDLGADLFDVNVVEFVNNDVDGDTISSLSNVNQVSLDVSEKPIVIKLLVPGNTALNRNKNHDDLKLYPVPADDELKIISNDLGNYKIIDIQGRTVLSGTLQPGQLIISVASLKQGLYFLYHEEQKIPFKILILHNSD